MATRRVTGSPIKRVVPGSQRFSISNRSSGNNSGILPTESGEVYNKYNKRKSNKRSSRKFLTCICLCLIGICAGLLFGVSLVYFMGHAVVDNNKVVSHIRQKTKETFDSAYNKVSKTFDESQRYQKAFGNVKEIGKKNPENIKFILKENDKENAL